MSWMTEHTLAARSQISFLEQNKRETKTAVHSVLMPGVKSNIQAEEEELNLQLMTGSKWQRDDYQLYEINHYPHTQKSNESDLNIRTQREGDTRTRLKNNLKTSPKFGRRYREVLYMLYYSRSRNRPTET